MKACLFIVLAVAAITSGCALDRSLQLKVPRNEAGVGTNGISAEEAMQWFRELAADRHWAVHEPKATDSGVPVYWVDIADLSYGRFASLWVHGQYVEFLVTFYGTKEDVLRAWALLEPITNRLDQRHIQYKVVNLASIIPP